MDPSLSLDSDPAKQRAFWRNPCQWVKQQQLSRGYWVFFSAAFFFDAGFAVYFFLFNLYLLDHGFNEQAIGWITGSLTLGSMIGILPAGLFARRFGVRRLLIFCATASPLVGVARVFALWEPAQIGLAFLAGLAMCTWGVSLLPAVARLTTEANRGSAYSLIFSVSAGTSILGGLVCSNLALWLATAGLVLPAAQVKGLILLGSCAVAALTLVPALHLRVPREAAPEPPFRLRLDGRDFVRKAEEHPFLLRFLPAMALWTALLAAFNPFANVYLTRELHLPLPQVSLIFSAVQVVQLSMGLLTPLLFRAVGLVNGIVVTQVAAALVLGCLGLAHRGGWAIPLYLIFSAAQWMGSPGLYSLLMNRTPDSARSTATAATLFCNSLAGSAATAAAGVLLTHLGYAPVMLALAVAGLAIAGLFHLLFGRMHATEETHSPATASPVELSNQEIV